MLNIGVRVSSPRLRSGAATRSGAVRADPTVFAAVYERHQQELYRYCRSIVQHEEDARDALQNTMAKAYAALQTEERDFELRPWLFRIAHNEAISLIRRRPATDELDERAGGCPETLQRSAESRERLSHLYADLQDLPERQRAALMMRELNGLSTGEIAEALQIPVAGVKQTIYEARTGLHECAAGRDMACDEVQRTLSDADGRLVKSRRMRAHLRSCRSCQQFRRALTARPAELQVLFPVVPLAAGTALLAALKGGTAAGTATAGGTGAAAGTSVMGLGGGLVTLGAAKIAVVAATTVAAVGGVAVAVTHERHTPVHSGQTTEQSRASSATVPQRPSADAAKSSAAADAVAARRAGDAQPRSAASAVPTPSTTPDGRGRPKAEPGSSQATGSASAATGMPTAGAPADGSTTGTAAAQNATERRPGTTTTTAARPATSAGGSSASRAPAPPARPSTTSPTAGAAPATGTAVAPSAPATSSQSTGVPGERTAPTPATSLEDVVGSVVRPGGGRP